MSQLTRHPAYLSIADQLDAIGQKYRAQRLVRGGLLWLGTGLAVSVAAAMLAHWLEQSFWTRLLFVVWLGWMVATAVLWVLRPLVMRPRTLEVARLIESRVQGLHNGLTNGVLLANADDLQNNPWLPQVLEEIAAKSDGQVVSGAVRVVRDLRPLGIRLGALATLALVVGVLWPAQVSHGWRQLLSPAHFVPQVGLMQILDVQPGSATLVSGQPLEIAITAKGPGTPVAHLIFQGGGEVPSVDLNPVEVGTEDQLRYTYRLDHVDQSLRYRVEVGGTQSDWFNINVVRQVKLTGLSVQVTPPLYTRKPPQTVPIKPDEVEKAPLSVLQGSQVEVSGTVDVPVKGAMLQVGEAPPVAMTASSESDRFTASTVILDSAPMVLLLTDGSGQIVARLPDTPLAVQCIKDAGPTIEMKWPAQDTSVAPTHELRVQAMLKDDLGLTACRVLLATAADQPLVPVYERNLAEGTSSSELSFVLDLKPEKRQHGKSVRVQVEAIDNRNLIALLQGAGPQTTASPIIEIRFRDVQQIAKEQQEKADKLRERLMELLKKQQDLHTRTVSFKPGDQPVIARVNTGQTELRSTLIQTAETFEFDAATKVVQKTLLVLAHNPAKDAVDLSAAIGHEPMEQEQRRLSGELQTKQRRIISTLESLLAVLNTAAEPLAQLDKREGGDLPAKKEALEKLNEALKQFIKEEQRIIDQSAPLVKKPVDNWDDQDKKLLEDLLMAQEKLDAFMQDQIADFSQLSEQDMSNAALLKELLEVYAEVTMAKDSLKSQAVEIAVSLEEYGVELAKEATTNIEKWLSDKPDREKWTQEDPLEKNDVPMQELPTELEDLVGELMEEQEDLFEEMEDPNANWHDSLDKGAGWDALDGPIDNMSARGVTGNQLPNNNEMGGRAGEGRSGRSQGEMVEETASGKGGRNTPTRLDPTAFQQGQIKDTSQDPVGGATGGGKLSGQGGAGLEGPVPPHIKQEMQRLAQKQAELRNKAERLNLQYQVGRYDNFKLLESIALMRRVESDLHDNRYQTAMYRRDVMLDAMDTSKMLLGGRIHVQQDTSPTMSRKLEQQINDAMKGQLPAAWAEPLKEYYKKLAAE